MNLPRALLVLILLAAPPAPAAPRWTFEVRLPAETAPLALRACSDVAQAAVRFAAGDGAGRDLRAAARSGEGGLERDGDGLVARDWRAGECLHAEIDLIAAAERDRHGLGRRAGHYLRVAPRQWLWRPREIDPESTIRFAELPPHWSVSAPWEPVEGARRLGDTPRDWPAVVVFGRLDRVTIVSGGAPQRRMEVAIVPTTDASHARAVMDWLPFVFNDLERLAGAFPRAFVQAIVVPLPGRSEPVPWGQTTRGGGVALQFYVGTGATTAQRRADWTAHHEFAHLLHPYLGARGRWLAEGLASYYQNVLRARSGAFSAPEAWSRLAAGFARGRAATPADAMSLERAAATHARGSTMRVYWGGAAFWLEADLALRASGSSLDALLGAFNARHGARECCWSAESFIDALHALAPAAALPTRFRRHAEARVFPLSEAQVAALGAQVDAPRMPIAVVLARGGSATGARVEGAGPGAP
jgi:hypothetical protein